jgi:hypothetical protein
MGMLTRWVRKIHTYTGLLNFSILLVFGIAGLTATVQPERRFRTDVEVVEFRPPANVSDLDAARAAHAFLRLPLSHMPGRNVVHRDAANNVVFNDYTVNGPRVLTLLENPGQIRIERQRNSIWHYFDNLHASTVGESSNDVLMRMWTWYTEFAIWSLIFMSMSGVYLWLATRPAYRWAQLSFAAGCGLFLALYVVTR